MFTANFLLYAEGLYVGGCIPQEMKEHFTCENVIEYYPETFDITYCEATFCDENNCNNFDGRIVVCPREDPNGKHTLYSYWSMLTGNCGVEGVFVSASDEWAKHEGNKD